MLGSFAAAADLDPVQEDSVLALARLYGAVRYFHPGDSGQRIPWDRLLVDATGRALEVRDQREIGPVLRKTFGEAFQGVEIAPSPFPRRAAEKPPAKGVAWRHAGLGIGQTNEPYRSWRTGRDDTPGIAEDAVAIPSRGGEDPWATFPLAGGWHARMPVMLSSKDALVTPAQNDAIERLSAQLPTWDPASDSVTRSQGIAVGISLWSIARHFYPYWLETKLDWDAELQQWTRMQPERQTRGDLRSALRRLSARLEDGHVSILDERLTVTQGTLPIAVRPLGEGFVVTASDVADVRVGDVIKSFNGRPISEALRDWTAMAPGGAHARPWRVRSDLIYARAGTHAELLLQRGDEAKSAKVEYLPARREMVEKRPDAVTEIRAGTFYVDLTRLNRADFDRALAQMKSARSIIFDLRGYPTGDAREVASFWLSGADDARWMHVPILDRPFEGAAAYKHLGWNLSPRTELQNARKILLIDPRAVSYSESLTGYFAAHARGVMIGEPTYGANGNVSRVKLPGGFAFRFTGMDVTTHDGRRFHSRGFQPDIPIVPTLEGIRAGRDEVLERALEVAARD